MDRDQQVFIAMPLELFSNDRLRMIHLCQLTLKAYLQHTQRVREALCSCILGVSKCRFYVLIGVVLTSLYQYGDSSPRRHVVTSSVTDREDNHVHHGDSNHKTGSLNVHMSTSTYH